MLINTHNWWNEGNIRRKINQFLEGLDKVIDLHFIARCWRITYNALSLSNFCYSWIADQHEHPFHLNSYMHITSKYIYRLICRILIFNWTKQKGFLSFTTSQFIVGYAAYHTLITLIYKLNKHVQQIGLSITRAHKDKTTGFMTMRSGHFLNICIYHLVPNSTKMDVPNSIQCMATSLL